MTRQPRTARIEWRTTPELKAKALALADGRPLSVLLDKVINHLAAQENPLNRPWPPLAPAN